MGSKAKANDAEAVAYLLWQMKTIATKEVENLPNHSVASFLLDLPPPSPFTSSPSPSQKTKEERLLRVDQRSRAVSVESIDNITENVPITLTPAKRSKNNGYLEHHDWSKRDSIKFGRPSRNNPKTRPGPKNSKSKSESFVGQTTKSGIIRATLQRKFSWKNYPEVCIGPCHIRTFVHCLTVNLFRNALSLSLTHTYLFVKA